MLTNILIEAVRPKYMGIKGEALAKPVENAEFLGDGSAWLRGLDALEKMHAVTPAFLALDRSSWRGDLPESLRLTIEERLGRERMILSILDYELDAALYLLIGAGIPYVLFNGLEIGRKYYPERMARPVSALDILVRPEHFSDALRVLGRAEYRSKVEEVFSHHVTLLRRQGASEVRLHSRLLADDSSRAIAEFFDRSVESKVSGLPLNSRVLSPEDQFIYLVRHGAIRNRLRSPVWLNDLHFLISNPEFKQSADWDRIFWNLAQARALGGAWFVMNFLAVKWGTQVPNEALDVVERKVGSIRKVFLSRMVNPVEWFDCDERPLTFDLGSRFLLKDGLFAGFSNQRNEIGATP